MTISSHSGGGRVADNRGTAKIYLRRDQERATEKQNRGRKRRRVFPNRLFGDFGGLYKRKSGRGEFIKRVGCWGVGHQKRICVCKEGRFRGLEEESWWHPSLWTCSGERTMGEPTTAWE